MIAVATGAGIVLVFLLFGLAVPFVVWVLSKRERIGDGDRGVDRSDAEQWARRDGEAERNRDRDRR